MPPSIRSSTSAEAERNPPSGTATASPCRNHATAEVVRGRPTTPPDLSPHSARRASDHSRSSADAGVRKGVRVLSLAST
jgi:hypothetical protein